MEARRLTAPRLLEVTYPDRKVWLEVYTPDEDAPGPRPDWTRVEWPDGAVLFFRVESGPPASLRPGRPAATGADLRLFLPGGLAAEEEPPVDLFTREA